MKRIFALLIIAIFLSGCQNLYEDSYIGKTGPKTGKPPELIDGGDPKADHDTLMKKGYKPLGYSMILSSKSFSRMRDDALEQAEKVNADLVMFYAEITGRETYNMPMSLPKVTTVNTTASGNIYNNSSRNIGSYSGTSSSNIWGTETVYIPQTRNYSKSLTTYWISPKR